MIDETEERVTEGVESDNEGVDNEVLPSDRKGYILKNNNNVNYSDKRGTQRSMECNNITVGSNELKSVAKAYVNIVNAIDTFFKPTPPTNIITNETILTQYSIKKGLNVFSKKGKASVRRELHQFIGHRVLNLRNPKTSVMNSREGVWHI